MDQRIVLGPQLDGAGQPRHLGPGDHLLHGVLCLAGLGFDTGGDTMIYIVIHPDHHEGLVLSGVYSNRMAAQKCADEAGVYQGEVFAVDMNEVQDTYKEVS